ncbi:MAG: hypothetical protein EOO46_15055 [Flavobacterium sp.]|nr:MAG: hypothetical protein EOO46_15055 [Flavobacterium sp.]
MTTSFKGEYVSFWIRLTKKLAPIILLLLFVVFKIEYGRPILTNYKSYWYIFIIVCFLIGLFYHVRDIRTVVTEISFSGDKIRISGFDFNSKFEDALKTNGSGDQDGRSVRGYRLVAQLNGGLSISRKSGRDFLSNDR